MKDFVSEASFWLPEYLPVSAWVEHAPFAFWLIDALRPGLLVELGTHTGFSYFAFTQALKRLRVRTRCYAVDTWKGDEHSGFYGEEVFNEVAEHNFRQYGDFSELVRATFDAAVASFEDGSIDLLHIDGRHYYEDVKHDFETWRPKLSDKAVVMLHDTNVSIRDFGVYRLWQELAQEYPAFEFLEGHGLGVLGIGKELPGPLQALFAASRDENATQQIRHAYARLGRSVADHMDLNRGISAANSAAAQEIQNLKEEAARLEAEREALQRELDQRHAARQQEHAELKRRCRQLEREAATAAEKYSREFREEHERARKERDELTKQVQKSATQLRNLQERLSALRSERVETQAKLSKAIARREYLEHELAKLGVQVCALMNSASWRVTAPLRAVKTWIAGGRRVFNTPFRFLGWLATFQMGERMQLRSEKRFLLESGLFDQKFYVEQYSGLAEVAKDPVEEYLRTGAAAGRNPNPVFDSRWYLEQNPDVGRSGVNPLLHYLQVGWRERRNPGPLFQINFYLAQSEDLAKTENEPLLHYLRYGGFEGRDPHPFFDSAWYLAQNSDVREAGLNPLAHFLSRGWKEGRSPHSLFDYGFYLDRNPDVANAGVNALLHFLEAGAAEGRDPHPLFDTRWYLNKYRDVAESKVVPFFHYLKDGWKEGRSPCAFFDGAFYLKEYPEVANGKICALAHYLVIGASQGYEPSQLFDSDFYLKQNRDVIASGWNPLVHYARFGVVEGRLTRPAEAYAGRERMLGERVRVVFVSGEPHTPGHHYRIENIMTALPPRYFDVDLVKINELPALLGKVAGAHLVWIWRAPWSDRIAAVVATARQDGAKIVFDVDDLMFRPELAVTEVIDGIRSMGLTEQEVKELYLAIQNTMTQADHCTVPTTSLASEAKDFWKTVSVIPNGFDRQTFEAARSAWRERRKEKNDGLIRIGYATGSRTHQRDLGIAAPALAAVLSENPSARLVLFREALILEEFPQLRRLEGQIEWRDLVPVEELAFEYARFDINLAPLEVGNRFCETKSELKFFEAALVGVPTIASPTRPFANAIRHGETGFLANGDTEWYKYLNQLVRNNSQREEMAEAGYREVLWLYGPERRTLLITRLVNRLLASPSLNSDLFLHEIKHEAAGPLPEISIPEYDLLYQSERKRVSRVSVIIPLFNYAQYVEAALESVRQQSVREIDVIVVDDRSTDNSVEIVSKWLKQHAGAFNMVALLQNRQNSKLGATRNAGVAFCDTELFFPLDPDNLLLPKCLEKCIRLLDDTGAAFVYPTIEVFGDRTEVIGTLTYNPAYFQCGNFVDAMAAVRKAAWIAVGGYGALDPQGYEDYDFWCKLAEQGMYGARLNETAARYRAHGASMLCTITDLPENKKQVLQSMFERHPWLQLPA